MTAVGFEPTPLRTGALSQRLRPLGQTVLFDLEEMGLRKPRHVKRVSWLTRMAISMSVAMLPEDVGGSYLIISVSRWNFLMHHSSSHIYRKGAAEKTERLFLRKNSTNASKMTPVGFEPTQLALVELESTPLDHSGKVS